MSLMSRPSKKGILKLTPAGLKGSRISASVPRPSAVSTQSASRALTFKSMPLKMNISPKYHCQHSNKRREKLCVIQHSRFKLELSITDTNNQKNQLCSWNKLHPQWTEVNALFPSTQQHTGGQRGWNSFLKSTHCISLVKLKPQVMKKISSMHSQQNNKQYHHQLCIS